MTFPTAIVALHLLAGMLLLSQVFAVDLLAWGNGSLTLSASLGLLLLAQRFRGLRRALLYATLLSGMVGCMECTVPPLVRVTVGGYHDWELVPRFWDWVQRIACGGYLGFGVGLVLGLPVKWQIDAERQGSPALGSRLLGECALWMACLSLLCAGYSWVALSTVALSAGTAMLAALAAVIGAVSSAGLASEANPVRPLQVILQKLGPVGLVLTCSALLTTHDAEPAKDALYRGLLGIARSGDSEAVIIGSTHFVTLIAPVLLIWPSTPTLSLPGARAVISAYTRLRAGVLVAGFLGLFALGGNSSIGHVAFELRTWTIEDEARASNSCAAGRYFLQYGCYSESLLLAPHAGFVVKGIWGRRTIGKVRLEKDFVELIPDNRHEWPMIMLPYGESLVPLREREGFCRDIRAGTFREYGSDDYFAYRQEVPCFVKLRDRSRVKPPIYVPLALRKCLSEEP